jgi:hypothetical protein
MAVDDVLEVSAARQRWDSVPNSADLPASGKAVVRWHEQTKRRHLVRVRYHQGARPQYWHQRFVTAIIGTATTTAAASSLFVVVHHL